MSGDQIANRRAPNILIFQAEGIDYQRLTPLRAAQTTEPQRLATIFVFLEKKACNLG
jgi:hypothetical protein